MKYKTLRELVLSHSQEEWFLHNKKNIMFELNHCELHHIDSYFLNLYNAGIKDLDNPNSSNILYLLGMTTVEPHKRIDTIGGGFPDIDSDFSNDKRQQIFDYLKAKYGDGFAHLGTITYTAGKQVFKSAARIHGMSFEKANKISNLMPDLNCPRLEDLLEENSDIKKLYNSDAEIKEIWDDAIKLQDCVNACGIHACGVALSDRPLWEDVPLWDSKGKTVTQWEGNKIEEYAGIVKLGIWRFQ